ncbi:Holliday junction resolvase RecU [Aquibacillus koreensis]|uniref:Holliday junction resolvase RecU n=1 Tax=Aquibacillus koreensis TaxID=279446 RepID=A0A9X4AGL0_9BACI|nr:Holliday junction resolvase RecU [Aquibacillus koreensis]MCT2537348.1 Holliday junction resolvase RecU [Aquibacillus koreensis]MDC3418794.1 Holliday junction resolvase RecU [Aquibacillus koreensis]
MNYPNGKKPSRQVNQMNKEKTSFSKRGMTLEEDINETNTFYLHSNKAVIHKKPTPVQIVKVDYPKRSAAVIKEGYFKQASTTDYNGIYQGKYIDFEAKETKNKTSFPLANIHDHQVEHMQSVCEQGGICFLIIRFAFHDETYFFPAVKLFSFWNSQFNGGKKSIPYNKIKEVGIKIPFSYQARVDYLKVIDQLYF